MRTYYRLVLRHRVAVLLICASLTVLAGLSLSRVTLSTSLSKLFLEDTVDHQRYVERVKRYGGSEQLIIGLEQPDLKSPTVQTRLRRIVAQLEALDGVSRVTSIFSAVPAGSLADVDALAVDPVVGGLLLSSDRRHTSIVVEFEPDDLHTLELAPVVIGEVMEIFEHEGIASGSLHFGGFIAMLAEIARQSRRNLVWITPLVGTLMLLMVYLFFRRLWPVLLTMLVAVLAIVWSMGFACLLEREFSMLLVLVPALILLISFSDVVHLCSAYARELAGGRDRDDAILTSAVDVGTACIMTSLTTFVGFVSLSLIEVAAFRRFGFVLGFGTAVALILAMTLVPVIFSFMRPPRPWTHENHRRPGRILDAVLAVCERVATGYPWKVIGSFMVLMVALALGCTQIRVEADFVARMSRSNPLRVATQYFNDHFCGTLAIELFLTAEDGITIGPEFFERLAACRRVIEDHPEVTKVIPPFGVASSLGPAPADLTRFVDAERREVRLVAFIRETGVSAIYSIGKKLQQDALTALGPGVAVEPSGFFYLAGRWLDHHIVTNKRAVLTAFAVIAVILVVLFRSIRIGLWSLLPNVFPLLAVGGVLGFVWRTVDSDLVIILLIAMGIAVDDTIHFLSRWRIEIRRGASSTEALHRAFGFAGRAIVKTSVIFAVGFAPMALSGYLPFRMLGILMPLAVITALLGDLLLLPALVRVGAIRMPA